MSCSVNAAHQEMFQTHDRATFTPVQKSDLTCAELKKAMESLAFLEEKRDSQIKGRACEAGSAKRPHMPKEEAASPTAAAEAILIVGAI